MNDPKVAFIQNGRPVLWTQVTTQDLIATIRRDADEIDTFRARETFTRRCGPGWRDYAPAKPRESVTSPVDGVQIKWCNYSEDLGL